MSAIITAHKQLRRVQAARGRGFHPARQLVRGDPGILDSIWSGIKGAATGFLGGGLPGMIAGGVGGLVSGNKGKPVNPSASHGPGGLLGSALQQVSINRAAVATPLAAGPGGGDVNIFSPHGTIALPPMLSDGRGNTTQGGTSAVTDWNDRPNSLSAGCPSGYHPNKSGFYSKRYGWVPPRSMCVRNRRRNPLNPRAASRAMARLTSAKKATRSILKFFGGSSRAPGAKRGGCGCRGKRR